MGAPAATTPANGTCEELSCIRASSTVVGIGTIYCSYRLMVRLVTWSSWARPSCVNPRDVRTCLSS
jgi:hypothetical protein